MASQADAPEDRELAGIAHPDRRLAGDDESDLRRLLSHPSKPQRLRAAAALSEAIAANRVDPDLLSRLLCGGNDDVRWSAAFAASRAGVQSDAVLGAALEALDFEDGDVRWAAASIVTSAARSSDSLRARLRVLATGGSPRSRKMALLCLCDSGAADGALYRAALADEDPFVRLAAVTSIARSGAATSDSLAALRRTSETDRDARVRRGAAAVLSRLSA